MIQTKTYPGSVSGVWVFKPLFVTSYTSHHHCDTYVLTSRVCYRYFSSRSSRVHRWGRYSPFRTAPPASGDFAGRSTAMWVREFLWDVCPSWWRRSYLSVVYVNCFVWFVSHQSTVYGMAFALLLLMAKRFKVIDDSKHETLFTRTVSALVVLLGAGGLAVSAASVTSQRLRCCSLKTSIPTNIWLIHYYCDIVLIVPDNERTWRWSFSCMTEISNCKHFFQGYFLFSTSCPSKEECNKIHAYISFIPVSQCLFKWWS